MRAQLQVVRAHNFVEWRVLGKFIALCIVLFVVFSDNTLDQ